MFEMLVSESVGGYFRFLASSCLNNLFVMTCFTSLLTKHTVSLQSHFHSYNWNTFTFSVTATFSLVPLNVNRSPRYNHN